MKRALCILLAVLLVIGSTAHGASVIVTFADPVLGAMVRASMGRPEGDITVDEAEAVTRLNLSMEWEQYIPEAKPIQDVSGLEYFKNLESLDLSFNAITDITPLAKLNKLNLLSLSGNPIADIAPLTALTNLRVLTLTGCVAQDYSPLAKLVNLSILKLNNSTLTDVSPLASLTNLKYLYLEDCPISNYFPLSDIYQSLEQKDFNIAYTLAELGFLMDNSSKQAIYDGENASIRINHNEWGAPSEDWQKNCVRTVFMQNDYKIDIGYYPNIDAYVMMANRDGHFVMNYVYDDAKDSFTFGIGDRKSSEKTVRAMLSDADAEDILLAPIQTFRGILADTLDISADILFEMPFEPMTLNSLGFVLDEANAAFTYSEHKPHDMHISIYRPQWGKSSDGRNIEFYDDNVNGYNLLILYFADTGKYHIALLKKGADCAFDICPATNEYGWDYPDIDTVQQMFSAAFNTQGKEMYQAPMAYFEKAVKDRFNISIDELLTLPVKE